MSKEIKINTKLLDEYLQNNHLSLYAFGKASKIQMSTLLKLYKNDLTLPISIIIKVIAIINVSFKDFIRYD